MFVLELSRRGESPDELLLTSHIQGVAQMVRLRGGVKRISIPVLYNLLEWYFILASTHTSTRG